MLAHRPLLSHFTNTLKDAMTLKVNKEEEEMERIKESPIILKMIGQVFKF